MLILLYQIAQEKKKQIKKLCGQMHIQVKEVSPQEYGQALGITAGILPKNTVGLQQSPVLDMPMKNPLSIGAAEEMLVFCGLQQSVMEEFLRRYKEEGIEPISLKAVVTQYNIFWSLGQLQEELRRERKEMEKCRPFPTNS